MSIASKIRGSLSVKLPLLFMIMAAVPVILVGSFVSYKSTQSLRKLIGEMLEARANDFVQMCRIQHEQAEVTLGLAEKQLEKLFVNRGGNLGAIENEDLDRIGAAFGVLATVFRFEDGRLVRIATTIKDEKGKRAVGTTIEGDSPVYQSLRSGKTFHGFARVLGKDSLTHYEPITKGGTAVGALFVGLNLGNIQNIKQAIDKVRIGKKGYVYSVNPKGLIQAHPTLDVDTDLSKLEFIQQQIKMEPGLMRYVYKGDPKTSYVARFEPWNWTIVATNHDDDVFADLRRNQWLSIIAAALAILAAAWAGWWVSKRIVAPIKRAEGMAQNLSQGSLSMRVGEAGEDEVGRMGKALDSFADTLSRDMVGTLKKVAAGDLSAEIKPLSPKDEVMPALQATSQSIKSLVADAQALARAAREGKLQERADLGRYQGSYRDLLLQLNALMQGVAEPLEAANRAMARLADKDLTARMDGEYSGAYDQLAQGVNTAGTNLEQALLQTSEGAIQVASASDQISSASQALSQSATEQAASIEEISASLEEVSNQTRRNAESAHQAKQLSERARDLAERGDQSMLRMKGSIAEIKQNSDETAKILKSIDEIAFQTNLLALNAAVEAARAGEAGKGFAVVAEEVRALAQRSAEAAKNTAALIEKSVRSAEGGVSITEEVAVTLSDILGSAKKVNDLVAEISAASEEQKQGIDQVNQGVSQLNQTTQSTAAGSEETASASEELNAQAQSLQSMVETFTINKKIANYHPEGMKRPKLGIAQKMAEAARSATAKPRTGNGFKPQAHAESILPLAEDELRSL